MAATKTVAVSLASGQILDIFESIANGIHCWTGCGCKRKKEAIDDFNMFILNSKSFERDFRKWKDDRLQTEIRQPGFEVQLCPRVFNTSLHFSL